MHLHKLSHGSKVMVLGRKVSPENDQNFQKMVEIEKRTLDTSQKFIEVNIKKVFITIDFVFRLPKAVGSLIHACNFCCLVFKYLSFFKVIL